MYRTIRHYTCLSVKVKKKKTYFRNKRDSKFVSDQDSPNIENYEKYVDVGTPVLKHIPGNKTLEVYDPVT